MFDVNSVKPAYSIPDLLVVIFLGVIGGLLGSLYNYLVDKVLRTYNIINEYVIPPPPHFEFSFFIVVFPGVNDYIYLLQERPYI